MTSVRYSIIAAILCVIFFTGCLTQPETTPPEQQPPVVPPAVCRNVSEEVPSVAEECSNVTYTETICSVRKLNYSMAQPAKVDLCIGDGACVGKPLGDCQGCSKAMSRCILQITNLEPQKSGTWSVGANYTLGNSGFNKDPITAYIAPNQTYAFDFNQIYVPGQPINSASCVLYIVSEPSFEDCHEETDVRLKCTNVTKTTIVRKTVCE